MKYQLKFYEEGYQPALHKFEEERDSYALLGNFESASPFMAINVGDFVDPKEWPYDLAAYFEVAKVEHHISSTIHLINVYIRNPRREVS